MADTTESLTAELERLRQLRASGLRRIEYDGTSTEYRTDAEIASAIRDLETRLAALSPQGPVRVTYIKSSKGAA